MGLEPVPCTQEAKRPILGKGRKAMMTMRHAPTGTTEDRRAQQEASMQEALEALRTVTGAPEPALEALGADDGLLWPETCAALLTGIAALLRLDKGTLETLSGLIATVVHGPARPACAERLETLCACCREYAAGAPDEPAFGRRALSALLEAQGAAPDRAQFVAEMAVQSMPAELQAAQQGCAPAATELAVEIERCAAAYTAKCVARVRAAVVLQHTARRCAVLAGLRAVARDFNMTRSRTLRALVMEEQRFTETVGKVVTLFYEPVVAPGSSGKLVLPIEQTGAIFSTLPQLLVMHQQMAARLRRVAEREWPRVAGLATIALEAGKLFDLHVVYARNSEYARAVLQDALGSSRAFKQIVERGQQVLETAGQTTDFAGYLSTPLRRVACYDALYRSLLKTFAPTDPAYEDMRRAADFVAAANRQVVAAQQAAHARSQAALLLTALGGFTDTTLRDNDERVVVLDSPVALVVKGKTKNRRWVYLMTDIVVFAEARRQQADAQQQAALQQQQQQGGSQQQQQTGVQQQQRKGRLVRAVPLYNIRIVQDDPRTEALNPTLLSLLVGPANEACDMITMHFETPHDRSRFAEALRARSVKNIARDKCVTASAPNPVFGTDLVEIVANERACTGSGTGSTGTGSTGVDTALVPVFVRKCIARLSTPAALECEGIFRLSGSTSRMNAMRQRIENSATPDSWDLQADDDTLSVSGVLKAFLRELPNPLMTLEHQGAILAAWRSSSGGGADGEVAAVQRVCGALERLPREHLATFLAINALLEAVAAHAAENRMDPKNLSIVFAPNYFGQADFDSFGGGGMQCAFDLTTALVAHNAAIRAHFAAHPCWAAAAAALPATGMLDCTH